MKIKSMILLLVALCFVLASCSGKKEADSNKDTQQNQQQTQQQESSEGGSDSDLPETTDKAVVDKALEVMKAVPEYPEGYPTLEDVTLMYQKANMAVGWIIGTEKVAVYEDDVLMVDGLAYKRVRPDCFYGADNLEKYADKFDDSQKLIFNMECLEAYLCTLMSPDEAEAYIEDIEDGMDFSKFVEDENGNLYVFPFSYEPEGYGKEVYTLDDNGDGTYTFNVAYTILDEDGNVEKEKTAKFDFVQIDGRWVFKRFRVLRQ